MTNLYVIALANDRGQSSLECFSLFNVFPSQFKLWLPRKLMSKVASLTLRPHTNLNVKVLLGRNVSPHN